MVTWDDSDSYEDDSEEEQASIALMARTGALNQNQIQTVKMYFLI